jgi:DNA-binding HxlR family transcriptional regulator
MKQLHKRKVTRALDLDRACVIREGDGEYCIYPLDDVVAVLGRKWTLFIIAVLGNAGRTRFNDLLRQLKGISPRTLTDRLRDLEELQLIERTVYPEVPLRVEYTLTEDGKGMRRALIPFLQWSINFEMGRGSKPM